MARPQPQEHIATLCAAGTLGLAATGFALASEDFDFEDTPRDSSQLVAVSTSNHVTRTSDYASVPAALHQSPATSDTSHPPSRSASIFRKRRLRDFRPGTSSGSETSGSRGSSLNRALGHRPYTADTRATSEKREPSAGSSWLKRISTISTTTGSSPSGSIIQHDERSGTEQPLPANKLVKRSTSQMSHSDDQVQKLFLRRPATSHQRSATMRDVERPFVSVATAVNGFPNRGESRSTWRPYFEHGAPKKRHSVGTLNETTNMLFVPESSQRRPMLMLGSSVTRSESGETDHQARHRSRLQEGSLLTGRQRLRRSLSSVPRFSRRRYFTDPVQSDTSDLSVQPISSPIKRSPISPLSAVSAFDVAISSESPIIGSSPPYVQSTSRFPVRKRESNIQSDPTTLSSDNDTRVFTDDDSLEFQSDSAFDSMATRATVYSQRNTGTPKAETIFLDNGDLNSSEDAASLVRLMDQTTITPIQRLPLPTDLAVSGEYDRTDIDLHNIANEQLLGDNARVSISPVKHSVDGQDKTPLRADIMALTDEFLAATLDDMDEINWSPKSDAVPDSSSRRTRFQNPTTPTSAAAPYPAIVDSGIVSGSHPRMSIFDWSEQQKSMDATRGHEIRPKTVHGKQPQDGIRSRSSGRKAQSQLHLRSQSVPGNRDAQVDPTHSAASKYGTWGLGHKPVSEEWSDDFEFDDADETVDLHDSNRDAASKLEDKELLRGVKVPQSIIDSQASVHFQFGQVQEFMLLVEELKRLRAQGVALGLLNGYSRLLWEDAESIINLATINDEEEELHFIRTGSSSAKDIFTDENNFSADHRSPLSKRADEPWTPPSTRCSEPGSASSTNTRPRGDSLAQAKNFLQTIHQNRAEFDSSPNNGADRTSQKLPFNTQDLKDLVVRSGTITRALKDIVRKAEGVSISPTKLPHKPKDPAFSQIFNTTDMSPSPPYRKPFLPVS